MGINQAKLKRTEKLKKSAKYQQKKSRQSRYKR